MFDVVVAFITGTLLPLIVKILIALLIYYVGTKLIKVVVNLTKKGLERAKIEASVETFLLSGERIALYGLLIFVIVGYVGIATSSIVALVGSVGVTVGLALQGSLSNLAGGVLILVLKPFKVGDYIVATGVEGTVTDIEIFYTKLSTTDNKKIVVPNGALSNTNIVNVSHEPYRRVDLSLPVAYDSDIKKVKDVLTKLAERNELIEKDRDVNVFIDEFADSSINFGFRMWTKAENYWTLKWQMMEDVKAAFDENGIEIPFNQLDVTVKGK
ncbi:MAG: mechanosensitive ion channel family protein [Lachnospiraceae bacterium]